MEIIDIMKIAYLSLNKLKYWYTFKNNKKYKNITYREARICDSGSNKGYFK